MTARPIGSGPFTTTSGWHRGSPTYCRANLLASLRAGLIALALLAVLMLIVLT